MPAGIKAGDIFHVEIPNAVATAIATPASLPVAHGVPVSPLGPNAVAGSCSGGMGCGFRAGNGMRQNGVTCAC